MITNNCHLCGREFPAKDPRHRFCSKLCERATNNELRRSKKNGIPFDRDRAIQHADRLRAIGSLDGKNFHVPCHVCNKMVLTNVRKRTFCSDEHRKAWEREKLLAKEERRRAEPNKATKIQPPPALRPVEIDVEAIPVNMDEFMRRRLEELTEQIVMAERIRSVVIQETRRTRPEINRFFNV